MWPKHIFYSGASVYLEEPTLDVLAVKQYTFYTVGNTVL